MTTCQAFWAGVASTVVFYFAAKGLLQTLKALGDWFQVDKHEVARQVAQEFREGKLR